MNTVITVANLGKKYELRHQRKERYVALKDIISDNIRQIAHSLFSPGKGERPGFPSVEEFWALKDVSFEVKKGDRIGIIGRNGAGKSTLLKILSRITEPTTGSVRIKGRVASLLEVGTGFHPELTGRENIFLNGAILGMSRAEIKKKFDEIVDFAEIEKFLDTPVKRYSSGMYVRLAFAVAAHLEPEILVVDEVLAVGDAQFQKKCLGKMEDVSAKQGRTVLFVSHNLVSLATLCNKGILIDRGVLKLFSDVDEVVTEYMNIGDLEMADRDLSTISERSGEGGARLLGCALLSHRGKRTNEIISGDPITLRIRFESPEILDHSYLAVQIYRFDNLPLFAFYSHLSGLSLRKKIGAQIAELALQQLPLFPSRYFIKIGICSPNDTLYDFIDPVLSVNVLPSNDLYHNFSNPKVGSVHLHGNWKMVETANE